MAGKFGTTDTPSGEATNGQVPDTTTTILPSTGQGSSSLPVDPNPAVLVEGGGDTTLASDNPLTQSTTAPSPTAQALGTTTPTDSATMTPPIAETAMTQPMDAAALLLQNPQMSITTGGDNALSAQQKQALRTLSDLAKPHEGSTPAVGTSIAQTGPAGYYTVLAGWVHSFGQKLMANIVGGRFHFHEDSLDEKAKSQLDKMVEQGTATKQEKSTLAEDGDAK